MNSESYQLDHFPALCLALGVSILVPTSYFYNENQVLQDEDWASA